jgi:hypothetical protein
MATGGATGDNIGSVQTDATARPNSNFTTGTESANHTHQEQHYATAGGSGLAPSVFTNRTGASFSDLNTNTQSANHTHTVTGGGDNETRPDNAYVMYCIKT